MQTCQALPYFYAFTGCDTTSQFLGKGKKSAWESCKAYPDAFKAFIFARDHPFQMLELKSSEMEILERYVCVLSLSTVVLNSRDCNGSQFPANKILTESRLTNQPQ